MTALLFGMDRRLAADAGRALALRAEGGRASPERLRLQAGPDDDAALQGDRHEGHGVLDLGRAGLPSCLISLTSGPVAWHLPAGYRMTAAPGGGHLFTATPGQTGRAALWMPQFPRRVRVDALGRVLAVEGVVPQALDVVDGGLHIGCGAEARPAETVVWELPPGMPLDAGTVLEAAPHYTLGSHTVVQGRADIYKHLIGGTVFENRQAWPNEWRVFSENDGHALHLILSGWNRARPDPLLQAMQDQVLLAVLDRQSPDGGYRHGEWTDRMESHYRLHCSAMHLMMDVLSERDDPKVARALKAAAEFLGRQSVKLTLGQWLLHDELEHSVEAMREGPFRWVPSTVFGKAESNMMVLNSHLDGLIALDRYGALTGDRQFDDLVASARGTTRAVLGLRPAERLYRTLMWLVELTFMPTPQASALPAWKRALKRLAWQHLIPRLPDIKARWPRLVMPGGYIDRELTLRTWAHDYHAINLMDLARYLRRFDEPEVRQALVEGLAFVRRTGLWQRWQEQGYQRYALGFWAEALYHVCTLLPEPQYRQWLAEAMLALEQQAMGQPPSLLGANAEAVPVAQQMPCPSPAGPALRVANLGRLDAPELLVVNAGAAALPLVWETEPVQAVVWHGADGRPVTGASPLVPAQGWLWGRAAQAGA